MQVYRLSDPSGHIYLSYILYGWLNRTGQLTACLLPPVSQIQTSQTACDLSVKADLEELQTTGEGRFIVLNETYKHMHNETNDLHFHHTWSSSAFRLFSFPMRAVKKRKENEKRKKKNNSTFHITLSEKMKHKSILLICFFLHWQFYDGNIYDLKLT